MAGFKKNVIADGKALFEYDGPFYHFETVQGHGIFHTYATSFAQAKNNILYQYKRLHGYTPNFNLKLDETKLKAVTEEV